MRALLLVLLLLPHAAAVVDDPSGDVATGAAGQTVFTGDHPSIDLVGLSVVENETAFLFTLEVVDIDARKEASHGGAATYSIDLHHRLVHYRIVAGDRVAGLGNGPFGASLRSVDDSGIEETVMRDLPVDVDAGQNTAEISVPRVALGDENGAPPFPGRVLEDIHVRAWLREVHGRNQCVDPVCAPFPGASDRAPDTDAVDYAVVLGGGEAAGIRLSSPEPFRLSNGEATTYLFVLQVANNEDRPLAIHLEAEAPEQWDVRFPVPNLELEPHGNQTVPVAIRVPFAHQHGGRQVANITAVADGARGETGLGVVHTTIPQPSGHHPTIWFHSTPGEGFQSMAPEIPFMSTLEDDDRASGAARETGVINAPLSPALGMGLQLAPSETGMARVVVQAGTLGGDYYAMGSVTHVAANGTRTPLFEVERLAGTSIAGGQTATVEAPLRIVAEQLRFPYERGAQLVASFYAGQEDPNTNPDIASYPPGTHFTLPLAEYQDDIAEAFEAIRSVALTIDRQEAQANPGDAIVLNATASNDGTERVLARFQVAGGNAGWASFTSDSVALDPGQQASTQLVVDVPADASPGEMADLLVELTSADGLLSLKRVVVTVVAEEEIQVADERDTIVAEPERRSPAPGALVALVCIALVRKRFK